MILLPSSITFLNLTLKLLQPHSLPTEHKNHPSLLWHDREESFTLLSIRLLLTFTVHQLRRLL
jgi:hypothetical protein